ncbi:hypothetical protein JCGZ_25814 [Jatropha curcas]|uniref:IST1-like protein n=1 Tax=Jatropha curcas TaxID=180498 RepID=A0A067JJS6_JATCU|nr:uncharacterized protein LOC105647048 [Jatropha curcas]KDP24157.1 hypothetical protein JCGZ_25814 [Jatropha curcas]
MFDFLFGWRKASKCKKLIKRIQCRLKLLKSKRYSIVRQLREDVAQLVKIGYEDIAFNRAEQLFKDETVMEIYELLESFCEFIIVHISYIRKHKECPNDINEAVSSLIYASARCGDLPELRAIRKLFRERYGQRFEMTALELLPGNLVNFQIKEKLSIQLVPDYVKQKLVDEITRDYSLKPEILALEYTSELQRQANEECNIQQADIISACHSCSMVDQSSPNIMESPMNSTENIFEHIALGAKDSETINKSYIVDCQKLTASSSESLPQFHEEIVYLDDIEEVQCSVAKEGNFQDQRIFKFRSSLNICKKGKEEDCCDIECMEKYESLSDCSSSSSSKRRVKTVKKRSRRRRRSVSTENTFVKDIECVIYYDKPYKRSHFQSPDTEMEWYAFSNRPISPLTRKAAKPPYLRAMTMPQERHKGDRTENVLRSKSFPIQSPYHVHPKLPDYDDIAAKFMALKKEHLQNIQH